MIINWIKNTWTKICLAWYILKANNNLVLTESVFHSTVKNIDLLGSKDNPYICLENKDGGFDIAYMIPWNMGQKCFTITVSRLKGDNAGAIADATLNALNNHSINDMITGDSKNQPKPSNYISYNN